MLLPQSTINVDSGLTWEQNLNNALKIIDGHNHSPGSGVQIPSSGINISSILSFNNNVASGMQAVTFIPQSSFAPLYSIYVQGVDLYYNDGTPNNIQITAGGLVNATSSGLTNGTGTASFTSSTLSVYLTADSTNPANVKAASILLGNNVTASNFLTLNAPAALASNISQTLPNNPAATKIVTLDSSGNYAAATDVDNSTLQISSNIISVKNLGINTAQLADGAVTPAKRSALGQQLSSSSGTFSTTSTSAVDVTNLTITITTTGRPVWIGLISDGTGVVSLLNIQSVGSPIALQGNFLIIRASTEIARYAVNTTTPDVTLSAVSCPSSALNTIDIIGAGTYTYKIQAFSSFSNSSTGCSKAKLIAYEL